MLQMTSGWKLGCLSPIESMCEFPQQMLRCKRLGHWLMD